jgi:hypothetical protein
MDTAQLTLVREPFDHPDYLFELKHDGFRALAYISEGHCELVSRRRNAYKSFGELRENLGALKVKDAVIDGELVCLDSKGRSIFNELLFRRGCSVFYAFDILYLNDCDLRQLPLIERKEILRNVIQKSALPDVLCGKYIEGRGVDLFNECSAPQFGRCCGEAQKRNLHDCFWLAKGEEPELHTVGASVRAVRLFQEASQTRTPAHTKEAATSGRPSGEKDWQVAPTVWKRTSRVPCSLIVQHNIQQ